MFEKIEVKVRGLEEEEKWATRIAWASFPTALYFGIKLLRALDKGSLTWEWLFIPIIVLALGSVFLIDEDKEELKRLHSCCEEIFGLELPNEEDWKQEKLLAIQIGKTLSKLARAVDVAFTAENEALEAFKWTDNVEDVLKTKKELDKLSMEAAEAKEAFWAAHEFAGELGFETKKSYKDYL